MKITSTTRIQSLVSRPLPIGVTNRPSSNATDRTMLFPPFLSQYWPSAHAFESLPYAIIDGVICYP